MKPNRYNPLVISYKLKQGFSIVEALLAGSVFALMVTALFGAYIYSIESISSAGNRGRAAELAEEALEAVRNLRDNNYSNLTDGTHGLSISGNTWNLSGASDTVGIFTRSTEITSVDAKRKQISSTVTWPVGPQRTSSITFITYLTDWRALGAGSWSSPAEQSSFDIAGVEDGLKLQVKNNYAYVIINSPSNNLITIDVSDPVSPSLASIVSIQNNPTNIAIAGNLIYISSRDDNGELQIFDISNPSLPVARGVLNLAGIADGLGVYAAGSAVYLTRDSSSENEFYIINALNPNSPTLTGSVNLNGGGREVVVSGTKAYIASSNDMEEMQVVDITVPALPVMVGGLNISGETDGLSIAISSVSPTIVLGAADGLAYLINVTNPLIPALLSAYNAGGAVNDVSLGIGDTYAFIASANASAEFQVVNISNLSSPLGIGSVNTAPLAGIFYSNTNERAYGASSDNAQEFLIFSPN